MTPDSEVGCEKVETDDFEQDGNIFTLLFDQKDALITIVHL